jgi:hypothetical protein
MAGGGGGGFGFLSRGLEVMDEEQDAGDEKVKPDDSPDDFGF